MKKLVVATMIATGAWSLRAEDVFSKAVRPEDFNAAGLAKLSPVELARLDALVRDFKSGALEAARREAAAAEARAAKAEAEAKARAVVPAPAPQKSEGGFFSKAKVTLTPGTEVEYQTVQSRIVGEFRGWESRTVFRLESGQLWKVTGSDSYVSPPMANPAVKIEPGMLGSFWMTVEGVRPRVKVAPVSAK